MSSKHESGHAINVANFSQLRTLIPTLGISYSPPSDEMELSALSDHLSSSELALETVNEAASSFMTRAAFRSETFTQMPKFATKVINVLKATKAPKSLIKDAQAINKKIRGVRAKIDATETTEGATSEDGSTPSDDMAPSTRKISVSQRSYDNLAQHFSRLVKLTATHSRYTPTEPEFTISGLTAYANNLIDLNKEMDELSALLFSARFDRDTLLYAPETGIYDLAISIKNYIRSITSGTDPRYKQVASIRFTKKRS